MDFKNFNPQNLMPDVNTFMDNMRKELNPVDYGTIQRVNDASYMKQGRDELKKQNIKLSDQNDLLMQNIEELKTINTQLKEQKEALSNENKELIKQVEIINSEMKKMQKSHYIREGIFVIITGVITWLITEHWDKILTILLETLAK